MSSAPFTSSSRRQSNEYTKRLQKAALIFGSHHNDYNVSVQTDHFALLKKLKSLKLKETRLWWDQATLKSYIEKQMVPRGLRINKRTATVYSQTFTAEWNDILTQCSLDLMKLIVKYENDSLKTVGSEITRLQSIITSAVLPPNLSRLQREIEQNVQKLEAHIIETKKSKFRRDTQDYEKGQVYIRRRRLQSASHPKSYESQSYGSRERSFSNYEGSSDYTNYATTDDPSHSSGDDSFNTSNRRHFSNASGSFNRENISALGARPKYGGREVDGSTSQKRYPRRTKAFFRKMNQ